MRGGTYFRVYGAVVTALPLLLLENDLSNLTLDGIEKELQLMNIILAEANDIAMLSAFAAMPADLDNESRAALRLLRDKMMMRARARVAQ